MKALIFFLLLVFWNDLFAQQEVEIHSNGIVVPRIANTQRPLSPKIGHLVFNTSQMQFEYYNGSGWSSLQNESI